MSIYTWNVIKKEPETIDKYKNIFETENIYQKQFYIDSWWLISVLVKVILDCVDHIHSLNRNNIQNPIIFLNLAKPK